MCGLCSKEDGAKRVSAEIEASFLWLHDKTVQVILRAIKNTFARFPKKKQRICNTEKKMNGRQGSVLPSLPCSKVLAQCVTWQVDQTITVEGV